MVYKCLLDGYFFRWCPIFPKWDIYQPLFKNMFFLIKRNRDLLSRSQFQSEKKAIPSPKSWFLGYKLGIVLPQNGSNMAFYSGKWGFDVSDHEVNQNEHSESQSKNVSVLKISARIFPSTRRLIWSIMILYASIWVCLKIGYIPNYSHLIGIMISKTIGFRGTLFSDTPICILFVWKSYHMLSPLLPFMDATSAPWSHLKKIAI